MSNKLFNFRNFKGFQGAMQINVKDSKNVDSDKELKVRVGLETRTFSTTEMML